MGRNLSVHKRQASKRARSRTHQAKKRKAAMAKVLARRCRSCGCTQNDCRQCIEAQGFACWWVTNDLCSRCAAP